MQRQSLGSPVSKLHSNGGSKEEIQTVDDPKRKDLLASSSASSSSPPPDYEDYDLKLTKPRRFSLSAPVSPSQSKKPERFTIHLIPILIVVSFFILYLSSHTPSQSDLAQFKGLKLSTKQLDSDEIIDDGRLIGDVAVGIHSMRNLQEIEKHAPRSRSHRKIADF